MVMIEPGLMLRLQSHQYIVPNQVSLAQGFAGRVHALKNQLGIILVSA